MIKDKVLACLLCSNGYVSGQSISEQLKVSRMAVNTAVSALRADGYKINAVTRKGYRLIGSPDVLNIGELAARLSPDIAKKITVLNTVDSTNREIKRRATEQCIDGTVVLANEQTDGRGRLGRTFVSPKNKGIYLSFLLKTACSPQDCTKLTAAAAVAARRAILTVCGLNTGIKWVNDLVIDGKKVCGILTEISIEGETAQTNYVVIGIGINVNQAAEEFKGELADKATSVYAVTGKKFSRAALAAELIKNLNLLAQDLPEKQQDYLNEYRAANITVGKEIFLKSNGQTQRGKAVKINEDFSLAVEFSDGTKQNIRSGEVSVRGIYGYV